MNIYKLNKRNIFNIVVILIMISVSGIAFFFYPSTFVSFLTKSTTVIKIIGFFLSIISIFLLLGYITLIFSSYGFKINEDGIVNNTNLTNVGIIYWNDITSIRIKNLKRNTIILIFVKSDDKYYERVKNPLKMINILTYKKSYGCSFVIEPKNLLCSAEKLNSILQKKMTMCNNIKSAGNKASSPNDDRSKKDWMK